MRNPCLYCGKECSGTFCSFGCNRRWTVRSRESEVTLVSINAKLDAIMEYFGIKG